MFLVSCFKTFGLLLVTELFILYVGAIEENDLIIPFVKAVFERKCLKNSNYSTFEAVLDSAINLKKCTGENLKPPNNNQDIISFVCNDLRQSDYVCLKIFTEKLGPCLEPEENYLTQFILDTRKANFDYVCKNQGNDLRALNSLNVGYCQRKELNVLSACLPNSQLVKNLSKIDYVLTKTALCSDLEDLRNCLAEGTRIQCRDDRKVAEYLALAYGTYTSKCDSDPFTENAID